MNGTIKKRWLKALRSGKYKQGKKSLKTEEGNFCCLGVLCDLYINSKEGKENKSIWEKNKGMNRYQIVVRGEVNPVILPEVVKKWAGLNATNPILENSDESYTSLAEFNDNGGYGFERIANKIEKYL